MNKKLSALDIHKKALNLAGSLMNKKVEGISGIKRGEDVWKVFVEVLERKAIPDTQDHLGVYALVLDDDGDLLEYTRVELRRRSDRSAMEDI